MSSLTDNDKRYLEALLGMRTGYVLDYSNANFAALFKSHSIDINSRKYQIYGPSKANRMRAFWDQEPDSVVAAVLADLLDSYVVWCELANRVVDHKLLSRCREIVARLSGRQETSRPLENVDALSITFPLQALEQLPVDAQVRHVIAARFEEAHKALSTGAFLSVIVLCGSVLEGVLYGAAQRQPEKFNRSPLSPKTAEGKVKPFREWNLAQLIDVACDVGLLTLDVKKFSHQLRYFRNYIHPYEEVQSGFTPDEHTAKLCLQVLNAALADLVEPR